MSSGEKTADAVIKLVKSLPPLPEIACQAMTILNDPFVTPSSLSRLISQDATLAARVMRVANSSMFGRTSAVHSLNESIVLIGLKMLRGLILAAAMQRMVTPFREESKVIWSNSIGTALISAELARELHVPHDESFTQGLLHDIGKVPDDEPELPHARHSPHVAAC